MSDFEKWQEEFSPDRKEISVCFDRALLYQFEEASTRADSLREQAKGMLDAGEDSKEAEEQLQELTEKVRAAQRTLVFESIGTRKWRDLLSEHPPEGDQRKVVTLVGLPLEFNPDTFVPAAIHACSVEPKITAKEAEWFAAEMPVKEVDRVFGAVLTINVTGLDRPFGDTGNHLLGVRK